jgi:hypothetical protein
MLWGSHLVGEADILSMAFFNISDSMLMIVIGEVMLKERERERERERDKERERERGE